MVAALLRSRVYDNEFMAGEYVRRLRLRIEWERQPAPEKRHSRPLFRRASVAGWRG